MERNRVLRTVLRDVCTCMMMAQGDCKQISFGTSAIRARSRHSVKLKAENTTTYASRFD
jgi:hypothetical protein